MPHLSRSRRAFTLIELVVVIVVIALLLGLAAFGYTKFVAGSRETAARSVAVQVAKAIQGHSANHQLPYGEAVYGETGTHPAPGVVAGDLPAGTTASVMVEADEPDPDTGKLDATVQVTHGRHTVDVVFTTGQIGTPGRVAGIGAAPGDGVGSGGGGPPADPLPATLTEAILGDGPAAYYPLDETTGSELVDASGNSRHGTYTAATVLGSPGLLPAGASGTAATFDGAAAYAEVPAAGWMTGGTFTVEALISPATVSGTRTVASRYDSNSFSASAWSLRQQDTRLELHIYAGNSYKVAQTAAFLTPGESYHVAGTYDGSTARVYVDGALAGSVAVTGMNTAPIRPFRIGRAGNSVPEAFIGTIDEVAYYDTALDAAALSVHTVYLRTPAAPDAGTGAYTSTVQADTPLLHAKLDDPSTHSSAHDSSGNHRHGLYSDVTRDGTALLDGNGVTGRPSATFRPHASYVEWGAADWMNTPEFTIEALIRPDTVAGTHTVASRYDPKSFSTSLWSLRQQDSRLELHIYVGNSYKIAATADMFAAGQTYHVAGTYDGTTARVYVNGALAGSIAAPGMNGAPARPLRVGRSGDSIPEAFSGNIGEVAYYGTALDGASLSSRARFLTPAPATVSGSYVQEALTDNPLLFAALNESRLPVAWNHVNLNRSGLFTPTVTIGEPGLASDGAARFGGGSFAEFAAAPWQVTDTFSIDAVIRPDTVSGTQTVVSRYDSKSFTESSWSLRLDGNRVGFYVFSGNSYKTATSTTTLTAGQTYHVAGTYDGTTARVYVNGSLAGSVAVTGMNAAPSRPLRIGRSGDSIPEPFNGVIDEVGFYGHVLSDARVAAHHAAR